MPGKQQQDAVYAEQLRLLFAAIPLSISATIINSLLMVAVLWSVMAHDRLALWGAAMLLVMLYRAVVAGWFARDSGRFTMRYWGKLFVTGVLLTAITWSGAAIFLFPADSIVHQVFIAFIFAGMTAGAVTTLAYLLVPAMLYVSLMLVPLAVQFFLGTDIMALAMGMMIVIFLLIIMSSTRRFFDNSRQNIELHFDAILRETALKESQSRYENIFHAAPLGVAHFDKDGVIIDCNETFSHLAGHDRESILATDVLAGMMDAGFRRLVVNTPAGELHQYETNAGVIGGSKKMDIRVFFRGMEQAGETLVIIEDISDEKRIEKLKSEFVSSVSHELRTPLTSIRGAVGLITGGAAGEVSESIASLAEIAASNTDRLLSIIDDILDIGKIESGTIDLEMTTVSLNGLLAGNIEDNRPYGANFGVNFSLSDSEEELCIRADSARLSQVLSNLLSNAAKFSPKNSVVDIELRKHDGKARISVTDYGAGIPEDFHASIFDRFTQSDATSTRVKGGTGLGLSISKALVEQMGGVIGFDTELDKKTTFYIEFTCVKCTDSVS